MLDDLKVTRVDIAGNKIAAAWLRNGQQVYRPWAVVAVAASRSEVGQTEGASSEATVKIDALEACPSLWVSEKSWAWADDGVLQGRYQGAWSYALRPVCSSQDA